MAGGGNKRIALGLGAGGLEPLFVCVPPGVGAIYGESSSMLAIHYGPVATMVALSVAFAAVALILAYLLRPVNLYEEKLLTYECGIVPWGEAWSKFFVRYYVIALIFVLFDIEAIFLIPWAVVYRKLSTAGGQLHLYPAIEMGIFLVILLLGLAYAWRKGDLEWA